MQKYHGVVQDNAGNVLSTGTITVLDAGTVNASSIFDDDETTPLSNPFTVSDSNYNLDGSFWFKGANALYDIQVVVGADTTTIEDVSLFDTTSQIKVSDLSGQLYANGDYPIQLLTDAQSTSDGFIFKSTYALTGKMARYIRSGIDIAWINGSDGTYGTIGGYEVDCGTSGTFSFRASGVYPKIEQKNPAGSVIGVLWFPIPTDPTYYLGYDSGTGTKFDIGSSLNSVNTEMFGNLTVSGNSSIGNAGTDTIGFHGSTPITQPVANADTSGASLTALETEVNELKQLLRDYGLLAS